MENFMKVAKQELYKYWNTLSSTPLLIDRPAMLIDMLIQTGTEIDSKCKDNFQEDLAVCISTPIPMVFVSEDNLKIILTHGSVSTETVVDNYKLILRHEYGHVLFYSELFKKSHDKNAYNYALLKRGLYNKESLAIHNNLAFLSLQEELQHYHEMIPNEADANMLSGVNVEELISAMVKLEALLYGN